MDKKRVLIVDDETDFIKIVKMNMEASGKYEVLALSDAKDIISHVHTFKPDVISLDILMPGMGGIEVCETLNNDPVGKNTPIIVLSALESDQDKLRAYKVGVVAYLVKPIEISELITKIEKVLEFK